MICQSALPVEFWTLIPLPPSVLMAYSKQAGLALATMDGVLAATALANGLTLATRNTKDFARFGLSLINPWDLP